MSWKQVAASVAGAVIAALALSSLGVSGTILGVALGSAAATLGSAAAFTSIEKGHERVRRLIGPEPRSLPEVQAVPASPEGDQLTSPTLEGLSMVLPAASAPPPLRVPPKTRRSRWPPLAAIGVTFALSLGVVSVIELAVGKPLSSIVSGSNDTQAKTSVGDLLNGGATTTSTTSTTTTPESTTTSSSSTTTSTSTTTSSTTTSAPPSTSSAASARP